MRVFENGACLHWKFLNFVLIQFAYIHYEIENLPFKVV